MDAKFKALTTNHTWTLVPFQGQNNHTCFQGNLQTEASTKGLV